MSMIVKMMNKITIYNENSISMHSVDEYEMNKYQKYVNIITHRENKNNFDKLENVTFDKKLAIKAKQIFKELERL
tara:strand:- start:1347 stop:1571 length:225 start_codon:yes stop_codon:yes gene_type:complete